MRDIEFRGKKTSSKEWVYGYYYQTGDGGHRIIDFKGECWRVDLETVGQYIGSNDKKCNKVFEGDILKDKDTVCPVVWENYRFRFSIAGKPKGFDHYKAYSISTQLNEDAEIIGNVTDNPELLKQ